LLRLTGDEQGRSEAYMQTWTHHTHQLTHHARTHHTGTEETGAQADDFAEL
jgi:hypothetical protein